MPDPNPSERLAEIEARVEAATAGPWAFEPREWAKGTAVIRLGEDDQEGFDHHSEANASFIAHAREDIPWLLEQLREARLRADIYEEHLRFVASGDGEFAAQDAQAILDRVADSGEASG